MWFLKKMSVPRCGMGSKLPWICTNPHTVKAHGPLLLAIPVTEKSIFLKAPFRDSIVTEAMYLSSFRQGEAAFLRDSSAFMAKMRQKMVMIRWNGLRNN